MNSPQTTTAQFSDPAMPTAWTTDLTPIPAQPARSTGAAVSVSPAPSAVPAQSGPPAPSTDPLTGATSTVPSVVTPEPESRLDQLAAEFSTLKPQVDELTARLKGITDAIKQEVWSAGASSEDTPEVVLRSPHLSTAYRVHPVESWRIDTTKMKRESPQTYAYFARQSTSWRLDPVK